MKIKELLLSLDLTSKEINQRIKNKQIKINGVPIKNVNRELNFTDHIFEMGEWLCSHDIEFLTKLNNLKILFSELEIGELFNLKTNVQSNILKYLKSFICIQIDKKNFYILIKN